ncbi:unnamed protein product [Mytilus coruscus]|uniref:Uncharacterized protein n=1 Tax=Mytilus coruscus TaxID=42192 RepID=A0A6J8ADM7_MYTCO|nr:unnamed protein product [Mytilus coruscus]
MAHGVAFEPDFNEEIRVVYEFDKRLKFVQFDILRDTPPSSSDDNNNNQTNSNTQNAFDVLMGKATTKANSKMPSNLDETASRFTAKQKLFNGIVDMFPVVMTDKAISDQVIMPLTNAVWYISGNMGTIQERAKHLPNVQGIPASAKELKLHGQCVFKVSSKPFTNQWNIKDELHLLALSLDSYAEYLDTANQKQQNRQLQVHPVRQVDVDMSVQHVEKTNEVFNRYTKLDLAVSEMSFFEPLYFDEQALVSENMTSSQRYKFLSNLAISVDVHILQYDPGAGLGALTFFLEGSR